MTLGQDFSLHLIPLQGFLMLVWVTRNFFYSFIDINTGEPPTWRFTRRIRRNMLVYVNDHSRKPYPPISQVQPGRGLLL